MADLIAMCQRATDDALAMVRTVRPEDLTRPTPCTAWDVRALINHMIGTNQFFAHALAGDRTPPTPTGALPDLVGDDPAGAYAASARTVMDGWRAPGALERVLSLPFGDSPASVAITLDTADQLVHTWDLGQGLGREVALDPEIAAMVLEFSKGSAAHSSAATMLKPEMRGPNTFAPEVPCAPDAPVQDRLLAWLGRHP